MEDKDFELIIDALKQAQFEIYMRFVQERNMDDELVADIVGTVNRTVFQAMRKNYKNFKSRKWEKKLVDGSEHDDYILKTFGVNMSKVGKKTNKK
jgi:hypothetical protein